MPHEANFPSGIEGLAEKVLRKRIDDHVSGARVKGDDFARLGAGRNRSEVSDAADVLKHPAAFQIRKEREIQQRNEGRSLAAGHHVRRAKV